MIFSSILANSDTEISQKLLNYFRKKKYNRIGINLLNAKNLIQFHTKNIIENVKYVGDITYNHIHW